jgi:hypothetical protein
MHARLRHDHHPARRDAVSFSAGERLARGPVDADWPGWIQVTDSRGRSGRAPKSFFEGDAAVRDFDGRELEANAGDSVRLVELSDGWWLAENQIGEKGWLPEHALVIEPGMK